jgi:sporulation protein YlmC with PRC-barrel domain
VIVNPATQKISHLVVRAARPSRMERLVPMDLVAQTTPELILLRCDQATFAALPPFEQTDFVYTDVPHYATDPKLTLIWPYVVPAQRVVEGTMRRVAPEELAVRRGARVRATDGRIGRVDEFLVEPDTGQITHLIMREGHFWAPREIAIPVDFVEQVEEERVLLNRDKEAVAALPAIPVRRSWR